MNNKLDSLDVIMPAHDEADRIANSVNNVLTKVVYQLPNSRLIVINDGSRDETPKILREIEKEHAPRVQVFHKYNSGHGPTSHFGMNLSKADWILLLNNRNQVDLDTFMDIWEKRHQADIHVGRRREDCQIKPSEALLPKLTGAAISMLLKEKFHVTGVHFNLLKRSLWQELRHYIPQETLVPSPLLSIASKKLGYRTNEFEVCPASGSKNTFPPHELKTFPSYLQAIKQLIDFGFKINRSDAR